MTTKLRLTPFPPKRRGSGDNTGGGHNYVSSSSSKSSKGSTSNNIGSAGCRIKSKHFKQQDELDHNRSSGGGHDKVSKHHRGDDGNEGEKHRRGRLLSSRSPNNANSSSSSKSSEKAKANHRNHNNHSNNNRRKALDPTLLARGMSARTIGARISSKIQPLSNGEIERDIRHMEAYGTACIAYAQQFFIYANRDLVSGGAYGPVPSPSPGLMAHQQQKGEKDQHQNIGGVVGSDSSEGRQFGGQNYAGHRIPLSPPNLISSNTTVTTSTTSNPSISTSHSTGGGGITMPVRIDPEEEKRLSLLRKRVAQSEAKREVLETEYLSLRAHYVHQSHLLRTTRQAVTGQLSLLRLLSKKRGDVLALRRVRAAMAQDVLHTLLYRAQVQESGGVHNKRTIKMKNHHRSWCKIMQEYKQVRHKILIGNATTTTTPNQELLKKKALMLQNELCVLASSVAADNTKTANGSKKNEEQQEIDDRGDTTMTTVDNNSSSKKVPEDLIDIWSMIESQLHEAELSCSEVETPKELFQVKASLNAAASLMVNGVGGSGGENTLPTSTSTLSTMFGSSSRVKHEDDRDDSGTQGTTLPVGINGDCSSTKIKGNSKKNGTSSSSKTIEKDNKEEKGVEDQGDGNSTTKSHKRSRSNSTNSMNNNGSSHYHNHNSNSKHQEKKMSNEQEETKTMATDTASSVTSVITTKAESSKTTAISPNTDTVDDTDAKNKDHAGETSNDGDGGIAISNNHKQSQSNKKNNHQSSGNSSVNDEDDNVIPWTCQVMPRTPYDVSVYISNLSSVPDGAAAFACGNIFGNGEESMVWLPSNIPNPSSSPTSDPITTTCYQRKVDCQKLRRLRRQAKQLTEESKRDVAINRSWQKNLMENRKRSDELSAMIGVLRTETEAVLNRHNIILETNEARSLAKALHIKNSTKITKEDQTDDMDDEEMDDDEDVDDDLEEELEDDEDKDKSSDGGTVIEEDGEYVSPSLSSAVREVSQNKNNSDSAEEGEIPEEENVNNDGFEGDDRSRRRHQPMREVIFPRMSDGSSGTVVEEEEDGEIENDEGKMSTSSELGNNKRPFSGSGSGDGDTLENDIFLHQGVKRRRF